MYVRALFGFWVLQYVGQHSMEREGGGNQKTKRASARARTCVCTRAISSLEGGDFWKGPTPASKDGEQ